MSSLKEDSKRGGEEGKEEKVSAGALHDFRQRQPALRQEVLDPRRETLLEDQEKGCWRRGAVTL